jgi:hypothetical protein
MRQTISGLLAAIAVVTVGAAPALACGGEPYQGSCSPCGQSYASPCGGWAAHERLPDPVQQYYYVDKGPSYTGPGDFAPYPTYQESAVSGWDAYRHRPYYYGYDGGRYADAIHHRYDGAGLDGPVVYSYPTHPHFRPSRSHRGYGYQHRASVRYGYAAHQILRYGANIGSPHHGHMRRYY